MLAAVALVGDQRVRPPLRSPELGALLPRLERQIAALEYQATLNGVGLQAPNRAQGLRTYFAADGIRVVDRTAEADPPLLRLALAGFGRGEELPAAVAGEVTARGARVEIRRGELLEWYENRPAGLEQGFVSSRRPQGDGPLALELAVRDAEPTAAGDVVLFRSPAGRQLRYGELRAEDARGTRLPAHMALAGARVRLVVDDSAAVYPIAIDPLLTGTADTVLTNHGQSTGEIEFGQSVASAGDVNGDGFADLIVGAPQYGTGGAASIFLGGPNGIPSTSDIVTSPPPTVLSGNQAGDAFGWSVASAGDVNGDGYDDVIVGAYEYSATHTNEGAAFIFLGGPAGVANATPGTAATVLLGGQSFDSATNTGGSFGRTVAPAGDVNGDGYADVIVGAPTYSTGANLGAAFIFLGSASGVASATATSAASALTVAASESAGSTFALAVASAGDVNGDGYADVIVGAPEYESTTGPEYGAAFVFLGSASGVASATTDTAAAKLVCATASGVSGLTNPQFGVSVASAGDVNGDGYADVAVGAGDYGSAGAAFVFTGGASGVASGDELSAATTLLGNGTAGFGGYLFTPPPDPVAFGGVVNGDFNGDGYADLAVSNGTAAWVFAGGAGGIASGTSASASFSLPGGTGANNNVIANAGDVNGDGYDDLTAGDQQTYVLQGSVYAYHGGAIGLRTSVSQANKIFGAQSGAQIGASVATAGDIDGDGYSDVIIGAPAWDGGLPSEGAAFIFSGGPAGIPSSVSSSAVTTLHSGQIGSQFGQSVASAGDVNGDGYGDVIVGAPQYDAGVSAEGAAFVFLGGPSGIASGTATNASATFRSRQSGSSFGASVASAGDVNGDGLADVVIGARNYDSSFTNEGAAFVFDSGPGGLASGTPDTASAAILAHQANAQCGASVAGAGDTDGDGYDDVLVGAPMYGAGPGAALLAHGSASGVSGGVTLFILGSSTDSQFGISVAGAGDMNGDGYDDVVAANLASPGAGGGPSAYVFAGGPALPSSTSGATARLGLASSSTQISVAAAGDVNGDGFADVLLGTYSSATNSGAARIGFGRAALASLAFIQFATDAPGGTGFGSAIAGAGDVNGDGFADVLVGAPAANTSAVTYVFYGNGAAGRVALARQLRGDGGGAVAPAGNSLGSGFGVRVLGTSASGGGRVRAEVQTCPLGTPFGSGACTDAPSYPGWFTLTPAAPSVPLSTPLAGPDTPTRVHWRVRVLHANATGFLPPNPRHGPWLRQQALGQASDLRTSGAPGDADGDGVDDAIDNCPHRSNALQEDTGGFGIGSAPDGIGDACQCGNVADGGAVDTADVLAYRQSLANPAGVGLGADAQSRCVVVGTGTACDILQVTALRRGLHVPALAPLTSAPVAQVCPATRP